MHSIDGLYSSSYFQVFLAGAVEYTDYFSEEGEDIPNECPRFDTKQSDGEVPVILVVLNNLVVWMVSTRPPTSKSSSPFNNPLVTVLNFPITIGIIAISCSIAFSIP